MELSYDVILDIGEDGLVMGRRPAARERAGAGTQRHGGPGPEGGDVGTPPRDPGTHGAAGPAAALQNQEKEMDTGPDPDGSMEKNTGPDPDGSMEKNTGPDPDGSMEKNTGRAHRLILEATAAMEKAYAWTALPAEAVGAILITGFIALALAHAWLPGFKIPDAGPLKAAAAAWVLAAILTYMLYVPCRHTERTREPETVREWEGTAGDITLWFPLGLIAAGLLTAEIWEGEKARTAAGYALFAGLALAALRTTAGLAARIRRKLGGGTKP